MTEPTSGASDQDLSIDEKFRNLVEGRQREIPLFKAVQRSGPGLTPSQAARGDNSDIPEKTRNVAEERFREQQ